MLADLKGRCPGNDMRLIRDIADSKNHTLSPTSVRSLVAPSISRSGSRQASRMAFQYLSASNARPKQTFSRIVAFWWYGLVTAILGPIAWQYPLESKQFEGNKIPSRQTWHYLMFVAFRQLDLVTTTSSLHPLAPRSLSIDLGEWRGWFRAIWMVPLLRTWCFLLVRRSASYPECVCVFWDHRPAEEGCPKWTRHSRFRRQLSNLGHLSGFPQIPQLRIHRIDVLSHWLHRLWHWAKQLQRLRSANI